MDESSSTDSEEKVTKPKKKISPKNKPKISYRKPLVKVPKEDNSDSSNDSITDVKCPICETDLVSLTARQRNRHVSRCLGLVDNTLDSMQTGNITNDEPNTTSLQIQDPPELFDYNPFSVICPYPECGKQYEAKHFRAHVHASHKSDTQSHTCPICSLQTEQNIKVRKTTNLFKHLESNHSDLQIVYKPDEELLIQTNINEIKEVDTSYYISSVLETPLDQECMICYEEYNAGDYVARMPCFCLYHKDCIDKWFEKQQQCPFHMKDD